MIPVRNPIGEAFGKVGLLFFCIIFTIGLFSEYGSKIFKKQEIIKEECVQEWTGYRGVPVHRKIVGNQKYCK